MAAARPFLLDTNILIQLIRQNDIGRRINAAYDLTSHLGNALISVVTLGEIKALTTRWNWGSKQKGELDRLVDEIVALNINNEAIISRYGDFKALTVKEGRPMSDNDIWIAATASVVDAILLTTDKDFDFLAEEKRINRIWIDPKADSQSE